ncbi:glycosyltransferase family 2 protein [Pseudomonas aeruginosa]|uniref:glycosyltransferase family 2 protein n=1 Tax=Pseudomonas aeruginosa TaxID=287 RepID=UPI003968D9ED
MALVDDGSQPLVSVIIASYNHEKYIEASIASVAAQTYRNVELLVVDDGSSDGSVELLRGLQAKYGFDLRVQQNQGLSKTLNEAIARARGNLIVPFGSDDIMLPQRLEKQVAHMWDKPEVGICAGNIEIIDSNGRVMPGKEQRKRDLPFRRLDFDDLFLDRKHPTNTYKNARFMVDNVFKTYSQFSDHPDYEQVIMRFRNSMFLKCSNRDKVLARELLSGLPLKYWNEKTFRGIARLFFS